MDRPLRSEWLVTDSRQRQNAHYVLRCHPSTDVIPNRAEGAVRDLTPEGSIPVVNGNAPAAGTLEFPPAIMPPQAHRKVPHPAYGRVRDDIAKNNPWRYLIWTRSGAAALPTGFCGARQESKIDT